MKHLLTLTALLISSLAMGQMPYNPDSNGDDLIGATDLISVLGLYNTLMVDSSLTCDYEGTSLESLVGGLLSESLILDSVYVEYLLVDSALVYQPGCPEPVTIETVLDRSYMMTGNNLQSSSDRIEVTAYTTYLGYGRSMRLTLFFETGQYVWKFNDSEVGNLTSYESTSRWNGVSPDCCSDAAYLPFPENWTVDEDGIQVDWYTIHWAGNCDHLRIIPYWSEAE